MANVLEAFHCYILYFVIASVRRRVEGGGCGGLGPDYGRLVLRQEFVSGSVGDRKLGKGETGWRMDNWTIIELGGGL